MLIKENYQVWCISFLTKKAIASVTKGLTQELRKLVIKTFKIKKIICQV